MWIEQLTHWREERKIKFPSGRIVQMIASELGEYNEATQEPDAVVREYAEIDALADIVILATNELALKGYDLTKVLMETTKEIRSRQQDPEQAKRDWVNEKWQKDPNQDPDTLYKANYDECKLNQQ